jgi:hypothetical protein
VGFDTTVDFRLDGWRQADFAFYCWCFPFQHESLADAIDRVHMHAQPLANLPA